jgi:hypothetical protein
MLLFEQLARWLGATATSKGMSIVLNSLSEACLAGPSLTSCESKSFTLSKDGSQDELISCPVLVA